MKYTKKTLVNILCNTLGYAKENDVFNDEIIMSPISAFRYAVITGSGYLDINHFNKVVNVNRNLFRIYNQSEEYNIQQGLLDINIPRIYLNSNRIFKKYPYMVSGEKRLILFEYDSRVRSSNLPSHEVFEYINKQIIDKGKNPHNYIITLIDKNARDLEPFFEYVVSEYYNRLGYFTDTQIPFYYGVGTPDAAAFYDKELSEILYEKYGVYSCSIFELMHLNILEKQPIKPSPLEKDIVFEMKTTSLDGSQIIKYIEKNIFDYAYEVIPHKKNSSTYSGLIKFEDEGVIVHKDHESLITSSKRPYKIWLQNYIKQYLMMNLSESSFNNLLKENNISTNSKLIEYINKISYLDIINKIKEEDGM